ARTIEIGVTNIPCLRHPTDPGRDGYESSVAHISLYLGYRPCSSGKEQRAMTSVTRFVGLDYHQDSVQVCVMDSDGNVLANRSVENDWDAIVSCVGDVDPDVDPNDVSVTAAIESCSGAAHLAEELMERAGWTVTLGHPGIIN